VNEFEMWPETTGDDLPPLAAMLVALLDDADNTAAGDESDDHVTRQQLSIEEVSITLPVELAVRQAGAGTTVVASPPTQYTETTVMPVFHRLSMRLERERHA
jgi:hypothetical protein